MSKRGGIEEESAHTCCSLSSSSSSIDTQDLVVESSVHPRSAVMRPKRQRDPSEVDHSTCSSLVTSTADHSLPETSSVECLHSPPPPSLGIPGEAMRSVERRERKAQERMDRLQARLTTKSVRDLVTRCDKVTITESCFDYTALNCFVRAISGNFSQFNVHSIPRSEKAASMFPPSSSTQDCCQTFSTLAAVILGSMEFACHLRSAWTVSTAHYLLMLAAWLHHLSKNIWPSNGVRPTASDLKACLRLADFFPVHPTGEFMTFFYNQGNEMRLQIKSLITSPKRAKQPHPCGFTIVSGDFTIAVFALREGTLEKEEKGDTYTIVLADSHGTLPWSRDRVSLSSVVVSNCEPPDPAIGPDGKPNCVGTLPNGQAVYDLNTGIDHFCSILFALLEEHREVQYSILQSSLSAQQQSPNDVGSSPSEPSIVVGEVSRREVRGALATSQRSILSELLSSPLRMLPSSNTKPSPKQVPYQYLTWSPLVRKAPGTGLSLDELARKVTIDWLPAVMQNPGIPDKGRKWVASHQFFLGASTSKK